MQINGLWQRDSDQPDIIRPVITAKLIIHDKALPITLLIDTGADSTVLGSAFAEILGDVQQNTTDSFVSAGGQIDCFLAGVRLEFQDINDRPVKFSISCAVLKDPSQKNQHLLGRDILDYFTLICDRDGNKVTLLRPPHRYSIQT